MGEDIPIAQTLVVFSVGAFNLELEDSHKKKLNGKTAEEKSIQLTYYIIRQYRYD